MIEKVNPSHPDKVADRIAGAIVDEAYRLNDNPKIAIEALLGHGRCFIISETDTPIKEEVVVGIVKRIAGDFNVEYLEVKQDVHLSKNQEKTIKCGDNGIFKGVPLTDEEKYLSKFARSLYLVKPYDGKYILDNKKIIICQSNTKHIDIPDGYSGVVNPLGYWTGGTNVDTGAVNRKLGSDMAQSVTGGGLHGKDLSKADVSVNIYAFLKAQETGHTVELSCAIGDETIDETPYQEIVDIARRFVNELGGFEKLAEWGLF